MQSIAETCVRFDAAHLSINLVSEIAVPMFPTLKFKVQCYRYMTKVNCFLEPCVVCESRTSPEGLENEVHDILKWKSDEDKLEITLYAENVFQFEPS